jgi:hypothetical protein
LGNSHLGEGYTTATQYASAEILCSAAADMLGDAAQILHDAKDEDGRNELNALADKIGISLERLRRKRMAAEADGPDSGPC